MYHSILITFAVFIVSSSLPASPFSNWVRQVSRDDAVYTCSIYPKTNSFVRIIYDAVVGGDASNIETLKAAFVDLKNEPDSISKLIAMILFTHRYSYTSSFNNDFHSSIAHLENTELISVLAENVKNLSEVDFHNIIDVVQNFDMQISNSRWKFSLAGFAVVELLITSLDRAKALDRIYIFTGTTYKILSIVEKLEAALVSTAELAANSQVTRSRKSGGIAALEAREQVARTLLKITKSWTFDFPRSDVETSDTTELLNEALISDNNNIAALAAETLAEKLSALKIDELISRREFSNWDPNQAHYTAALNAEISKRLRAGVERYVEEANTSSLKDCARRFSVD